MPLITINEFTGEVFIWLLLGRTVFYMIHNRFKAEEFDYIAEGI